MMLAAVNLRSQIVISSTQVPDPIVWNRSQFATGSDAMHVVGCRLRALRRYWRQGRVATMNDPLTKKQIDPLIRTIRGYRVVLDADLARLYGVSTKALNQAVKRNSDRFPADFAFQLDWPEFDDLRSQFVTSSPQGSELIGKSGNRSQIVTGSQKHRDKRSLPWAFTEHGALMAANILRSERAVQMSVFVVRAFIRLREQLATNTEVVVRIADIEKRLLRHDQELLDLYLKLQALLEPPDPPQRAIGFHPGER